jgi:hypothetical protein
MSGDDTVVVVTKPNNHAKTWDGKTIRFMTLCAVSQRYGGPEEGGWWFDDYRPLVTWKLRRPVTENHFDTLTKYLWRKAGWRNKHNRTSVNGGEDAVILGEARLHERGNRPRPHYE